MDARAQIFTELLLEVFRLNGLLLAAGDDLTRPVGLSSARWQVLGVAEHGPVPVSHVARTMGLSRQSVQVTANGLARDGFITFAENPHHRRAKLMRVTEKGERALMYIREQQGLWSERIGGEQDLAGLEKALEVLRGVRGSLEQNVPRKGERGRHGQNGHGQNGTKR